MDTPTQDVTIVIAEDDDDDYFLTEKAFRDSEFSGPVQRVKDGKELMDFLHTSNDALLLIILDLNMPRKDGRQALREIKAHPELRKIPVVVLTTSMSETDVDTAYSLGANTFLRKPENFNLFLKSMKSLKHFWLEVSILPRFTAESVP